MNNIEKYPKCHMRTSLGNCDPIGGFCTSVNGSICEALHKAAESKIGEWIPCIKNGLIITELTRKEDVGRWYGYKCSKCNYIHKGDALIKYNYCPNCGTKMKK